MKLTFYRCSVILLLISALASCTKEYETIQELDERNIQSYLQQQNLNMEYDPAGFYYKIVEDGMGDTVKYSDKVYVTFTMKSLDGRYNSTDEYVNNRYSGFLGYLDREHAGLPAAFRDAVKKLDRGGAVRVIIPSRNAFGRNGSNSIPGNASLDCTLRLYNVNTQAEFDDVIINRFIDEKGLSFTKDTSGLYYQLIEPGTGTEPVADTTEITVQYKLRYLNGTLLQETTADKPYTSTLSSNISGFQLGVKKLKKGGKIRMLLPSALAYGSNPGNGIRSNAILDYDVELTDVKNE